MKANLSRLAKTAMFMLVIGLLFVPLLPPSSAATFNPISSPTAAYTSSTSLIPITQPDFANVTSLTNGSQTVTFSSAMQALTVPNSWATWNSPPNTETSTPRVLWTGGATSVTLTLANPTSVFGFETEPNPFNVHTITATFMSGASTLGTITRSVNGNAGALLAAASTDQPITHVQISSDVDFAIAQIRSGGGCQVSVTRLSQGNPLWKSNLYDGSDVLTIGQKGCALTCLSMALNFVGVANDPGSLNTFMKLKGDYNGLGVYWGPATRDASGPNSPFSPPKPMRFDTLGGWKDSRNDSISNPTGAFKALNDSLCSDDPHPVIVGVRGINSNCVPVGAFPILGDPGHFVLVTGKETDSMGNVRYLIADPGCAGNTSLDAYNNEFVTRGIVKDPPGDISELNVALGDGAEILVTAENRHRTGFDSATGNVLQDITGSAYFRDRLDNDETGEPSTETTHAVQIFQPGPGTYKITITGLKTATYVLSIRIYSEDGSPQPALSVPGVVGVGSSSSFEIQLSLTPGSTSSVVRVATFQSTLADIVNSLRLGLIDQEGIANSLSSKLNAAVQASARGQIQTSKSILGAFKNEVNAQAGKHINGLVVQILLQDADSLLNQ
jgi:hypothetical protein